MPQAAETITVQLAEPPVGIFRHALADREYDLLGEALTRLNQISGIIYLLRYSEELSPIAKTALGGLETLVDDTTALLTVIPSRGAA